MQEDTSGKKKNKKAYEQRKTVRIDEDDNRARGQREAKKRANERRQRRERVQRRDKERRRKEEIENRRREEREIREQERDLVEQRERESIACHKMMEEFDTFLFPVFSCMISHGCLSYEPDPL